MSQTVVVDFDIDSKPDTANQVALFIHCRECMKEKPSDQSPKEWMRLEVGQTESGGLQVRCVRHDLNVALFTIVIVGIVEDTTPEVESGSETLGRVLDEASSGNT